ncbi:MAG: glycosyltransferase family 1 protein [Candidatus Peregrinibacteria bacterium]
MKIGVNARFLTKPATGIGQYTKNLFRELAKTDSGNEYIFAVPEKIDEEVLRGFPANVRVKILKERRIGTAGMKKTWWEQITVPEAFLREKVEVAFFPYPSNPWTGDWYKKRIRTFVTVHDCIPWMRKEYVRGIMSKMYHNQVKKAVKRADVVLTVSEVSKKDIVDVCGVEAGKIRVVYNDADEVYKGKVEKTFADEVLGRFGIEGGKYFLYVGGYDERKNVSYLLDEFAKYDGGNALVLAGGKLFDNKLYKSFEEKTGGENVIRTGFLKEKELAAMYQNCTAFVNFSEQEGFNIPILEAANCGAPLILSDIEVHREIAGNAAIFANIQKKGEGVAAMKKMEKAAGEYSKKSKSLAEKYLWKSSAQKIKDMLS